MTKLKITKEQFNKSNYFQKKYGKLKYVSESGKLFKTSKGKVLKFNESHDDLDNDPAYKCPNCGGHNCEFWDAEEPSYYCDDGGIAAQFTCNDCGTDYVVYFDLKFTGSHEGQITKIKYPNS